MPMPDMLDIKIDKLRIVIESLLKAAGCNADVASEVGDIFVEADMRGHSVQGLDHFIYVMMRVLRSGRYDPNARPTLLREGQGYALLDGHWGPGQLAGIAAADLGVEKAAKAGCCAVGVINSSDLYMTGYYVERVARRGYIGLLFTDALPLMHPTGGVEKIIGTNPIAIGVPTAEEDPIVFDMSCATLIPKDARDGSRPIPEGVAIDKEGRPTRDGAIALAEGALSPIAGHKGYGLALCVAFLSASLLGTAVGKGLGRSVVSSSVDATGRRAANLWDKPDREAFGAIGSKGHLMIVIDPSSFVDPDKFKNAVTSYVKEIKESRKAPSVTEILVPGERSFAVRRESIKRATVRIEESVWQDTLELASVMGVDLGS